MYYITLKSCDVIIHSRSILNIILNAVLCIIFIRLYDLVLIMKGYSRYYWISLYNIPIWYIYIQSKFCSLSQWPAAFRWSSPTTPIFSTNKTDRHDITEILLKVALNTITINFSLPFSVTVHLPGELISIIAIDSLSFKC